MQKTSLPFLGVGIGLRTAFFKEIFETSRSIDWLEIISENFMAFGGAKRQVLHRARERWTLIPHGVGLSLGSLDFFSEDYVTRLKRLTQELNCPWFSDHLCFTHHSSREHHDLLPVLRTKETLNHLVERAQCIQDLIQRPLLLENISDYAPCERHEIDEPDFISEVLKRSGARLLLDLNNVYVNSRNSNFDPYAYLEQMPLEKVSQIHLAGHWDRGDLLIDTHGASVCDEVWKLYRFWIQKSGRPISTLIEWDSQIPSLDAVLDEADRARALMNEVLSTLELKKTQTSPLLEITREKDQIPEHSQTHSSLSLNHYLNLWNRALRGGKPVKSQALALGIPEHRLKSYQELVELRFLDLFQILFSRLSEVLVPTPWKSWIRAYIEHTPCAEWELNTFAKLFPKFLSELADQGKIERSLAELAQFEWLEFETRVFEKSELEALEELNPETLEVVLTPCLQVHLFEHDIGTWIQTLEQIPLKKRSLSRPQKQPCLIAVSRDPKSFQCIFTRLQTNGAQILQTLSEAPKNKAQLCALLKFLDPSFAEELLFLINQSVLLAPSTTVEVLKKISQNPSQCNPSILFPRPSSGESNTLSF